MLLNQRHLLFFSHILIIVNNITKKQVINESDQKQKTLQKRIKQKYSSSFPLYQSFMRHSQFKHSFSSTTDEIKYKLIMVGDSCVGKSSLFMRFIYGDSADELHTNVTTIDFNTKDVFLPDERESVKLFIWDTAGQERYRCIVSTYFKGCHGVLLVFDLTEPKSFQNIKSQWLPQIRRKAQGATIILVGNKCDLVQKIEDQQIQRFSRQNKLLYIKTSSRKNINVKQTFYKLTQMVNSKRDQMERRISFSINNQPKQVKIKKRNCCKQQ